MRHLLKWGYYLKKVSLLIDTYVYYILGYIGTYLNIWGGEAINRMGHLLERNNFSSFLRQLLVWGNYWCEAIYHENPVDTYNRNGMKSKKTCMFFIIVFYLQILKAECCRVQTQKAKQISLSLSKQNSITHKAP